MWHAEALEDSKPVQFTSGLRELAALTLTAAISGENGIALYLKISQSFASGGELFIASAQQSQQRALMHNLARQMYNIHLRAKHCPARRCEKFGDFSADSMGHRNDPRRGDSRSAIFRAA
jgi:hypothetical protein